MVQNNQKPTRRRKWIIALSATAVACLVLVVAVYAAVNVWPGLGAQAAELARRVVGNQVVADVENIVLQSEDQLKQLVSRVEGSSSTAPWKTAPSATSVPSATSAASLPSITSVPTQQNQATPTPPSFTPTASAPPPWELASIPPLGSTQGEGQWTAYLQTSSSKTVAYRTFLQPDPARPYAYVAIVAFDLQSTLLHFVLGYEEPISPVQIARPGEIPSKDLQPGILLAAFNGGFKAEHGHFGVMVNGITVLPPRADMGTVGLYDDGEVRIGVWKTDIISSPHLIVWRQNGPLIIQNGVINPHTANLAPQDWGLTVYGDTATYRSALGISADGKVLYYAAGPSLTLPALARALQDVGVAQAIQLDINNYWVHFESFQLSGNKLVAVPLLDNMKGPGDHRFLSAWSRDFFYVTVK